MSRGATTWIQAIDRPGSVARAAAGVAGVLLTQFVSVTDGLIVGIALPTISRDIGMSTVAASWVVNAYTIVFASFLILGGRLSDLLSRTFTFTAGQTLALAGCLLCAVATTPTMMYLGRGLQALGAAAATPAAVSLLTSRYADERSRGRAFGWLTAAGGMGWASAALLGGLIVGTIGWRWVFVDVAAAVVASMVLVAAGSWPRRNGRGSARLDLTSSLVLAAALITAASALSLLRPPISAWSASGAVLAVVVAALSVVWLVRDRGQRPYSVLPKQVFLRATVWRAALLGLLLPVSFVITQFAGPILNERVLGLQPALSSLVFLPLATMPVLVTGVIGKLRDLFGDRVCVAGGFMLCAAGFLWLTVRHDIWTAVVPAYVLIGIGVTAVYVGLAVLSVRGLGEDQLGTASGLFQCSNQVGGTVVLAAAAGLMAPAIGGSVDFGTADTSSALAAVRIAFVVGAVLCAMATVASATLLTRETAGETDG